MKTPREWAVRALEAHTGFLPGASDWEYRCGRPGLGAAVEDAVRRAVLEERERAVRLVRGSPDADRLVAEIRRGRG